MNYFTFTTGTLKSVMNSGETISIGRIEFERQGKDCYVFTPYKDIIAGLPEAVFSGIPGVDLEVVEERCLLTEEEIKRIEADEQLVFTAANSGQAVKKFNGGDAEGLQYGDKIIIEDFSAMGETANQLKKNIFDFVVNGVDIAGYGGKSYIDASNRTTFVSILVLQRMMEYRDNQEKRRAGIERAKKEGKYQGRKPIAVDQEALKQVAAELEEGKLSVKEAMERTGITSRSTFYRKLKTVK